MELSNINAHFKAAGVGVIDFRYDEKAFGSWFVVVESRGQSWRFVYDRRDAMLIFQETSQVAGWKDVKYQIVRGLSDEQKLCLATAWLEEINSPNLR